jgi:hypothetical protein
MARQKVAFVSKKAASDKLKITFFYIFVSDKKQLNV